jgi:hypothetical protein
MDNLFGGCGMGIQSVYWTKVREKYPNESKNIYQQTENTILHKEPTRCNFGSTVY